MNFGLRLIISLVSGLAVLLTATPVRSIEQKVSGHARTRYELQDNAANANTQATEAFLNRVRVNHDIWATKSLQVRLTPELRYTWGGGAGAFTAHEAWMGWAASDSMTFTIGRQILSYGNEVVIGDNDWNQAGMNYDAVRARLQLDGGWADVVVTRAVERQAHPDTGIVAGGVGTNSDYNVYGIYSNWDAKNTGFAKSIDLYALLNHDMRASAAGRNVTFVGGARLEGDMGSLNYNLEATGQFGKVAGVDQKGFQADATVGTGFMGNNTVDFNLAYANSEYQALFADVHRYFGDADLIARNNLVAFAVKTHWALNNAWSARLDGHYFIKAKSGLATGGGRVTTAGKSPLGMEGDLALNYAAEKNLAFEFGYALHKTLDAAKATAGDNVHSDIYAQGTLSF